MKLGMEVDLGPGNIVLDGDPALAPKGNSSPIFGPCILAKRLDGSRCPCHIVLDGEPAPPKPKGAQQLAPHFSAHVTCGQTAKMPLGRDVDFGSDDIVLEGDPAAPERAQQSPLFSVHVYCGQTVAHLTYAELLFNF